MTWYAKDYVYLNEPLTAASDVMTIVSWYSSSPVSPTVDRKDEMDLEDPYVYTGFVVPDDTKESKQC